MHNYSTFQSPLMTTHLTLCERQNSYDGFKGHNELIPWSNHLSDLNYYHFPPSSSHQITKTSLLFHGCSGHTPTLGPWHI